MEDFGEQVAEKLALFYADDGLAGSTNPKWLQCTLDMLIDLFFCGQMSKKGRGWLISQALLVAYFLWRHITNKWEVMAILFASNNTGR